MVPTRTASASEMNGGTVITNEETKQKLGTGGIALYSKVSLLDPELSFSLSDGQTEEIRKLSNQIDTETLITFWQFSIKTLEELNIVSNQNLSIEMFLIRLIHLKKIPNLEELLRNVQISQETTSSKGIEKLSNIKNEIKKDIIKETNQSTDQIKNIIQEKKEILDNDKTYKLPNENKNSTETVSNFDNLISLCLKHKEMQLKYDLEKNVSLVKFSFLSQCIN